MSNFDQFKDAGNDLLDNIKSSEFVTHLKHGLKAFKGERHVLPEQLQQKMEALDKNIDSFLQAEKQLVHQAEKLKREIAAFGQDAIAMYTPEFAGKQTTKKNGHDVNGDDKPQDKTSPQP